MSNCGQRSYLHSRLCGFHFNLTMNTFNLSIFGKAHMRVAEALTKRKLKEICNFKKANQKHDKVGQVDLTVLFMCRFLTSEFLENI